MTTVDNDRAATRRLEKITFDYSAAEDRLLARVQSVDGERSALWLTQRFARRLVSTLCSHLDKIASQQAPQHKESLLSFQQQAATLKHAPGMPVPEVDSRNAPLLQSVQVQLTQQRVLLKLELPDGPAMLPLTQDHVWQLLHVLHNLFRRADWPLDSWPDWLCDGDSSGTHAAAAREMH